MSEYDDEMCDRGQDHDLTTGDPKRRTDRRIRFVQWPCDPIVDDLAPKIELWRRTRGD